MNKIGIACQTIKKILNRTDIIIQFKIRFAIGNYNVTLWHWFAAETAGFMEEGGGIIGTHHIACFVADVDSGFDNSSFAFTAVIDIGD